MQLENIKGIGPKKAYKLNKLGIFTLKDLLSNTHNLFVIKANSTTHLSDV